VTKGVRSVFHVFRFVRHIPVFVYIIVVVFNTVVVIVVIVVELIHRFFLSHYIQVYLFFCRSL